MIVDNGSDDRIQSLTTVGNISYLLHAIVAVAGVVPGAQVGIGLLIVAFILDLVKKGEAAGTWQESHFSWRIRSVLWAGGLYVLTGPLWLLFLIPGMLAYAVISVWFLYRVIRGWMAMNKQQPMPQ
jgi:uncharacterized membrane protein